VIKNPSERNNNSKLLKDQRRNSNFSRENGRKEEDKNLVFPNRTFAQTLKAFPEKQLLDNSGNFLTTENDSISPRNYFLYQSASPDQKALDLLPTDISIKDNEKNENNIEKSDDKNRGIFIIFYSYSLI